MLAWMPGSYATLFQNFLLQVADEAAGKKGIAGESAAWGRDDCSTQSAAFSATGMRPMESIATLKPVLYAPWLGAARASESCV